MAKIERELLDRLQNLVNQDEIMRKGCMAFVIETLRAQDPAFAQTIDDHSTPDSNDAALTWIYHEDRENTPIYDAAYAAEDKFMRKLFTAAAAIY